ncbi:MAG: hypothetical protein NTX03_05755 [Bacteroidetes bacterium]|nr:hypothetical protein [Bacteroidota bacterium]
MQKIIGIILIVLGLLMVAFTGFNTVNAERVMTLKSGKGNQKKNYSMQWSSIFGAVFLIEGAVLVASNKKKSL